MCDDVEGVVSSEPEETVKKQIPFTFTVPTTFEALQELFEDRTAKEQVLIIERMIQCNHPQFGGDNKPKLEDLFRFLLQYIHDSACLGTILFIFFSVKNNYLFITAKDEIFSKKKIIFLANFFEFQNSTKLAKKLIHWYEGQRLNDFVCHI